MLFKQKASSSVIQDAKKKKKKKRICYLFLSEASQNIYRHVFYLSPLSPQHHPISVGRHLGGALPGCGGGPTGFGLGLVGMSCLRGRRGRRVPSLASLLEVTLVPGGLGEHLQPALLVLLQASPQLGALPLSLHLPGGKTR